MHLQGQDSATTRLYDVVVGTMPFVPVYQQAAGVERPLSLLSGEGGMNLGIGIRTCPKCRSKESKVTRTSRNDDGICIRTCVCKQCGHIFYTAQEPEYVVRRDKLKNTLNGNLRYGLALIDE